MDIRTVTVELLRAGRRHNQLLSPLTQYLGVCGNAAAGVVMLPYEHRDLETRVNELSYRVYAEDDVARRQTMLEKTGQEIADILTLVPGASGALNSAIERPDTLTQLRIVLSASELAMLPFELSKILTGAGSPGNWLVLQARTPVCITRHIRSVSAEGMRWPPDPRILFIAGPDTPFGEHRQALVRAMAPWGEDRLVTLERATCAEIEREVNAGARRRAPFSHVHILAHGAPLNENDRYSPFGVALHGQVLGGKQLATALTFVTDAGVGRPAVVTLATCDSARITDVRTPDASVAHDLHDQGIPLVVASQFPLSVEGSVPFVERFYEGQLWGEHPLVTLYDVRRKLHSMFGQETHDWASLVVYEAFPSDLAAQLEEVRYWQARRAQDRALEHLEAFAANPPAVQPSSWQERYSELAANATDIGARLPTRGQYVLECAGLRAAGHKRIALTALQLAVARGTPDEWRPKLLAECLRLLQESHAEYWRATKVYIASTSEPIRKKANLHWLLGQVLSLDVVLGRPLNMMSWTAARFAALVDADSHDQIERAWAYVSLAELTLLQLADGALPRDERARVAEETLAHAARVIELLGRGSEHVMTTSRQFDRYVDSWGNREYSSALGQLGIPDREHWHAEHGLVPTAKRAAEMMRPVMPSSNQSTTEKLQQQFVDAHTSSPAMGNQPPTPTTLSSSRAAVILETVVRNSAVFDIEMLPAENGDCLWIEYGDPKQPRRIVIDCGAVSTAHTLASRVTAIEQPFELFVLTHIDADHINGVLPLFANPAVPGRFNDIWFNGWRQVNQFLSVAQGEAFSRILEDPTLSLPWNRATTPEGAKIPAPVVIADDKPLPSFALPDGMQLTLLSPGASQLKRLGREWRHALLELESKAMLGRKVPPASVTDFDRFDVEAFARTREKRDPSAANGSSIALLAEFDGRSILLTGDAHADVLVASIRALQQERGQSGRKLKVDALKLSHHGSANATTSALLKALDCRRYLVSSNGNMFYHPDREAIARVIIDGSAEPTLVFNYRSTYNMLWDEPTLRSRYHYRTVYPREGTEGLRVSL